MTSPPHIAPIELPANQPKQFYRGGSSIARLRGEQQHDERSPEDWVASTTTRFGELSSGLSTLPDGTLLRDAVATDPLSWLGSRHVTAFGSNTALLVKLLDAGQRLPVHYHPSDTFAREHFTSHFGKTEAWVVIGTSGRDPRVYAGFTDHIDESTAAEWVSTQDSEAMLSALNSIPVAAGDTVFVPAGIPHAIGDGVFLVELQQPTDFSITIEWRGYLDSADAGHLGIGFDTALGALDRSAWTRERLDTLIGHHATDGELVDLLPPEAASYFRAHRLAPRTTARLERGFSVLIVLSGQGTLATEGGATLPLHKGSTVVIPYSAGVTTVSGELVAVRAAPPESGAS